MTPSQYRAVIAELGLSQVAAGRFLGITTRQSARYASGETPVPNDTAMLLRLMVILQLTPEEVTATLQRGQRRS